MPTKSWFKDRLRDPFLKKAHAEQYRSRAAYKLKEIIEKYAILGRNSKVLDLGAAPGSWSQVALQEVGPRGLVVGIDLLSIDPIEGCRLMQGDIRESLVRQELISQAPQGYDAVISDMAPNTTGIHHADTAFSVELVQIALEMCSSCLKKNGNFVAKVFEGGEYRDLLMKIKARFEFAKSFNPKASLTRSREVYVVAKGFKGRET